MNVQENNKIKSISITDYLNNDYKEAAIYMSYRSIPSLFGLKNSARKIIYTIKKKNLKENIKVSSLAGLITSEANYLHGDMSLSGAIVTATQDYTGSNNLPVLKGDGNFGTRFMPTPSAARYIFTKPQPYFNAIFKKEDDCNLIQQEFEGDLIEPRFYVPTIPLLLVNGCVGIGVGFATKILARPVENIIKALEAKLDDKRVISRYFIPGWKGFKGTVNRIDNTKWEIRGVATLKGRKLLIDEIPITYDLLGYIDVLKKLKDKGIIDKYDDLSDSTIDEFKFEVTLSSEEAKKDLEEIFKDLKLVINYTESITCLDENNAITEYNSIEEVFDKYYNIKIEYLEKRIKSEIDRLTKEKRDLKEVSDFIKEVVKGTINLKNKRILLEEEMKNKGYINIDKLLSMPLHSMTEEKVKEIEQKYLDKSDELERMKQETPVTLWKKDLEELKKLI